MEGLDELGAIDYDEVRRQFEINTLGPLRVVEACIPYLANCSKVGVVTSRVGSLGDNGSGGMYAYRVSKAGANMVALNLHHDLSKHGISVVGLNTAKLVFSGTAREAAAGFPANVNVVAALSLAGIGPEKTRIKIFASPERPLNRHRISIEGEFGRLAIEIENVPSENPRTGKLSYLSTIALLKDLSAPLRVGT